MNSNVNVIEYEGKYRQSVCLLFVQLQQHLVDIDPEHVQTIYEPYYNKYCDYVLNFLKHNSGKMYLAMDDGIIVGLVAGYVEEKDEEDKLTNRCPIRGVVSELVVDRSYRNSGIGSLLMDAIECYLKEQKCEYIVVNVFEPNADAYRFYEARQYAPRNIEMIKHRSKVTQKLLNVKEKGRDAYKIFDPVAIYKKGFATEAEYADIDFYIDDVCRRSDKIIEERMQSGKGIAYLSAFLIDSGDMERFQTILNAFKGHLLLSILDDYDRFLMEVLIEHLDDEDYIINLLDNDPVLDEKMDFSESEAFLRPAFRTKKYKVIKWLYWAGIDNDPVCGNKHPLIYAMQIDDIDFAKAYIEGMLLREELDFDVDEPGDRKCLEYAISNGLTKYAELFLQKGAKPNIPIDD